MAALDDDIRKVHERYWDTELQAARGKSVVLVEGDDDRDVLETILGSRRVTWAAGVRVVVAGGRTRVLERMKSTFPQAHGLVDRDTWTDAEVSRHACEQPRLQVTEGWCIENIFFDRTLLRRYASSVSDALARQRERWVRAGALWWTLQRKREAMQTWQVALDWSYGAPRDDMDLGSGAALADSLVQRIPDPVRREATLDIQAIAAEFERRVGEIVGLPEDAQWRVGVHGKRAFKELLVPALVAAHGSRQNWRVALAAEVGRPAPLDTLIAMILP